MGDWVEWELYYHFIWTTKDRQPLISPEMEAALYDALRAKSGEMAGSILAVNGMPDHVHMVASVPPDITVDDFIVGLKDYTARLMSHEYEMAFAWQTGYGTMTLDKKELDTAAAYVGAQKEHHSKHTTIWPLERTSDEDEGPGSPHPN